MRNDAPAQFPMTAHGTPYPRWPLWAGLFVVLVLFGLPLTLVLWIGRPGAPPPVLDATTAGTLHPLIIPPAPLAGLPPDLIHWLILCGGLSLGFALGVWPLVRLAGMMREIEWHMPRLRSHLLAALGLVSLFTYLLNFLLPFPLERYYNLTLVCMGRIADRDGGVALATTAAILALFLLYGLAYWLCRGPHGRRQWATIIIIALLLAGVNFFVAVITSTDVYDNIARGRITGVYGGNPYVHTPVDYPFEPFADYTSWDDATSAYGPLWETLGALLSRLAGDHLWPNVLAQKLLALAGYLLSVILIAAILRRIAPERAPAGTLLFAWNPLVLMEGVANAHNDLLMVALFLGAFWFMSQEGQVDERSHSRRLVYGGVALLLLTAAALVKFVPVLFFPFFLLYLLIPQRTWRRRLALGALLLAPAAWLVVQYYAVFWEWPAVADTFTRRAEMFRMSIPSAMVDILRPHLGEETASAVTREPFLWTFVLCYLGVLVRAAVALARAQTPGRHDPLALLPASWRKAGRILFGVIRAGQPMDILLRACLVSLLLYLLLVSFWFWPWYLLWPFALLALLGDERFLIPLFLAGCAGELAHMGWNYLWYWWGVTWETTYQIDALVIFGLTVPALLAYMLLGRRRRGRRLDAMPPTDAPGVPGPAAP